MAQGFVWGWLFLAECGHSVRMWSEGACHQMLCRLAWFSLLFFPGVAQRQINSGALAFPRLNLFTGDI